MVKKKIDNRIRVMIENGVKLGHRTMFIIVGDKARDQVRWIEVFVCFVKVIFFCWNTCYSEPQVPILYDMLTKSTVKARPTVLWCYKNKDEAISKYVALLTMFRTKNCFFSSHGKKRAKKIQAGKIDVNEADLFDTFRVSTTIHGRYYSETHTILGRTYGVCVLQVT